MEIDNNEIFHSIKLKYVSKIIKYPVGMTKL